MNEFQIIFVPNLFKDGRCDSFTQKSKKDLKENYRPISNPPIFSRVFEISMFAPMSSFLITFSQNNNVTSGKAIVHNNVFWLC